MTTAVPSEKPLNAKQQGKSSSSLLGRRMISISIKKHRYGEDQLDQETTRARVRLLLKATMEEVFFLWGKLRN